MKTLLLIFAASLIATGCNEVKPAPPEVQAYGKKNGTDTKTFEWKVIPAASDSNGGNLNYMTANVPDC